MSSRVTTRRGKCYHCGGDEHVRRNLCVQCRITSFTVSISDVISAAAKAAAAHPESESTHVTPRKASAKRAAESTSNPYLTSRGYRYCQGNCSTIPRPLSEFGQGESKKCLWCLSRQAGKANGVPRVPASPHTTGGTSNAAAQKSHGRPRTPSVEFETINCAAGDGSKAGPRRPTGRPVGVRERPPLSGAPPSGLGIAPSGLMVDTGVVLPPSPPNHNKPRTLKKAASFNVKRKRAVDGGSSLSNGGGARDDSDVGATAGADSDDGHPGLMPSSAGAAGTIVSSAMSPTANDSFSVEIRNALAGCGWAGFTNNNGRTFPDQQGQRRDSVVVPPLKRLMSMSVRQAVGARRVCGLDSTTHTRLAVCVAASLNSQGLLYMCVSLRMPRVVVVPAEPLLTLPRSAVPANRAYHLTRVRRCSSRPIWTAHLTTQTTV